VISLRLPMSRINSLPENALPRLHLASTFSVSTNGLLHDIVLVSAGSIRDFALAADCPIRPGPDGPGVRCATSRLARAAKEFVG
jgi:hypothetical protein